MVAEHQTAKENTFYFKKLVLEEENNLTVFFSLQSNLLLESLGTGVIDIILYSHFADQTASQDQPGFEND